MLSGSYPYVAGLDNQSVGEPSKLADRSIDPQLFNSGALSDG
jgi:hypothetical protein